MAKGKYEYWLTEDGLILLQGWARDGLIDEQIAHNMGIATGTLYDWENKYPEISEALKKGKEVVDFEVENALLKRALGFDYTETHNEFKDGELVKQTIVTKHMPSDPTSMIFWLKNRKKNAWRDRPEVEADAEAMRQIEELLGGVDSAIN